MRTWRELETAFRGLETGRREARLDYQGGSSGEHWRLCGGVTPSIRQQFEALASMAGAKVLLSDYAKNIEGVGTERNPVTRWYRVLVKLSGRFVQNGYGTEQDDDGNAVGNIYLGTLPSLCEVAADFCMVMEAKTASHSDEMDHFLGLKRYEGPREHWLRMKKALDSEPEDWAGAVHEGVSAVEGVARILVNDNSVTLGKAVDRIRQMNLAHPSLLKALEGIWGYSSDAPGIRHGATGALEISKAEAEFTLAISEGAVRMLVALDAKHLGLA